MSLQTEVTGNASVLVVDDNPLIVNVLKSLLLSEKYKVTTSGDGQEALDCLEKNNFDLIICDVMMPRMDGYELHSKIREKNEFAHIPFIFLTALGDATEVSKGREIGADDYIVKPFDPKDLLAVVKGKILRSRNIRSSTEHKYDNFRKKIIHTLSHEFRTPLVAINTGTELLIGQKDSIDIKKTKNLLEAIRRGGQRLERLVTDFMLLQQIEAGIAERLYTTRSDIREISSIIQDSIEANAENLAEEKFELSFEDHSDGAKVKVYEPQIRDILNRLISNSMKFKGEELKIEICAYKEDGHVIIEVRDRGLGIDPEKAKEALDLFGQIDRDKMEQQGGGLGLPIASRYAAINKGRLEFQKRVGGGSIVSISLPIAKN